VTFKNAIILGGSGFVGAHLQTELAKRNIPCAIGDLRHEPPTDVRKPFEIEGDFGAHTLLVNLAAVHKTPGHPDHEYFETNIHGAENACGFARKHGITHIVFTSSISPYGSSEAEKTEETLPMPNVPYGISKLVAEHIHREWAAEADGRHLTILRPGIVFGKDEGGNMTRLYGGLRSRKFAYTGRKDTVKACVYVKDLARLIVEMAENPKERVQLYNVSMFPAPTIEQIATAMLEVTGLKRHVPLVPTAPLMAAAYLGKVCGGFGLGVCPERVRKLMVSTNVNAEKLSRDYPLEFGLESAFADWFEECEREGLV
jgi:nucleoside-diphosphate-sugar epimerase